jgi:hypothetical protein
MITTGPTLGIPLPANMEESANVGIAQEVLILGKGARAIP